jgi:putative membrane protein
MAAERTLLAWMRTGLALMGFGFVVARFGLFLREIAAMGHVTVQQETTGWSLWIGTGLIALGVAISLLASWEYFRFVQLARQGRSYTPRTVVLAVVVSVILALLGTVMAVYLVLLGT